MEKGIDLQNIDFTKFAANHVNPYLWNFLSNFVVSDSESKLLAKKHGQ